MNCWLTRHRFVCVPTSLLALTCPGLDSSALIALIRRHSNAALKTFSIGFEESSLDESEFQKNLVDFLKVDHDWILCSNRDVAESFPQTIYQTESPVLRAAPTPMLRLSGLVRSAGYKVVLTGEGADEVLGGYDLFKEAKIRQFWARNPKSEWRPLLLKALYPYLENVEQPGKRLLDEFLRNRPRKAGRSGF